MKVIRVPKQSPPAALSPPPQLNTPNTASKEEPADQVRENAVFKSWQDGRCKDHREAPPHRLGTKHEQTIARGKRTIAYVRARFSSTKE